MRYSYSVLVPTPYSLWRSRKDGGATWQSQVCNCLSKYVSEGKKDPPLRDLSFLPAS